MTRILDSRPVTKASQSSCILDRVAYTSLPACRFRKDVSILIGSAWKAKELGDLTMSNLGGRLAAGVVLLTGLTQAAAAAEILIADDKSQPESLTVAPGGVLIVGSASTPFVYKVRAGSTTAEKFVDASAEGAGTFFFGMLADAATNTVWTCQLTPVAGATPVKRHTSLRGFDLSTGTQKLRWNLPGDNSTCNDFAIGPDKALYISDTANSRIYKLPLGASTADLFIEDRALYGIDGITFLNGT